MCSLGRGRAAVHFPLCCPSTTLQESQVATPNVRGSEEASPEREELENDTARGAEEQTDNFIVRKEKGIENDGLIYTGLHHTAFLQQGK